MTETKLSLTDDERAQLKQFVRLVQDMVGCRFIQRVRTQDHSIRIEKMEMVSFVLQRQDYDWEITGHFSLLFVRLLCQGMKKSIFQESEHSSAVR